jgi:hypothetical protein
VLVVAVLPSLIPYLGIVLAWFVTPIASLLVAVAYMQQIETIDAEIAALRTAQGSPRAAGPALQWALRQRPAAVRLAVAALIGALAGTAAVAVTELAFGIHDEAILALACSGAGCLAGGLVFWWLCRRLKPLAWPWTALAALLVSAGLGLSVAALASGSSAVALRTDRPSGGAVSATEPAVFVVEWEVARISHTTPVRSLTYNAAGDMLLSSDTSGVNGWPVRTWDATTGALKHEYRGNAYGPAVVSRDGLRIAAGSAFSLAAVWDAASAQLQYEASHPGPVLAVTFSPNNELLATGCDDDIVRLLNAADGQPVRQLFGCERSVRWLAFHPDGLELAAASDGDGAVHRWDVASGSHLPTLRPPSAARIRGLCYNADGSLLAVAEGAAIHVWDRHTWAARLDCQQFTNAMAFTPDGRLAVATFNSIDMWDLDLGAVVCRFTGHDSTVTAVAVNPLGTHLASGSEDATIRIWEVPAAFRAPPPR